MTSLDVGTHGVPDLHCSAQSVNLGENPAGSAGSAERYLLIELPMPWPKKIDDHALLDAVAPVDNAVGKTSILGISQAIGGDSHHRTDANGNLLHRVICYERPQDEAFVEFRRHQTLATSDQLAAIVTDVRRGETGRLGDAAEDSLLDLLVCTHGSRDRCCGQLGAALFVELADRATAGDLGDTRLWRASHLGGHRFAPTVVEFPTGMTWAYVDGATVPAIVDRRLDASAAARLARGTSGVGGRPEQMADVLGLAHHGWAWLAEPRRIDVQTASAQATTEASSLVVSVFSPVGDGVVNLEETASVPVPPCGAEIDQAVKSTKQYVVTDQRWR